MKPATPLPWGTDYSTACYWDVIAGGKQLCTLFDDDGNEANGCRTQSGYGADQAEQDAAYIAHAANLYPELVEALYAMVLCVEHLHEYPKADARKYLLAVKSPDGFVEHGAIRNARAVLAKAKGE